MFVFDLFFLPCFLGGGCPISNLLVLLQGILISFLRYLYLLLLLVISPKRSEMWWGQGSSRPVPSKGTTLAKDDYVMGTLGEGPFGQVKVALHPVIQTLVTMKILKRGISWDTPDQLWDWAPENFTASSHSTAAAGHWDQAENLPGDGMCCLGTPAETGHQVWASEAGGRCTYFIWASDFGHQIHTQSQYCPQRHQVWQHPLDWEGNIKLYDFGLGKRLASGKKVKGF